MITPEDFYGGAVDLATMSSDAEYTTFKGARVVRVGNNAGSYQIEVPDNPVSGGPLMYIINEDIGNDVDVYAGSTAVNNATVAGGNAAVLMFDGDEYYLMDLTIL